jgi:autotransporter-associated beta strand protein
MTKAGAGTLILGGSNTYTGGTNVNAGTLQGTTSSIQGNIANNAVVVFDQSTSGTYSGNMSGVGALTKNGSGSVTLSGSNTYSGATTVNAGTLTLGSNTAIGDTSAVTINGGEINVGSQSETVHSMAMNGGALTIGSGTLTLNNASSFTGGTVTLAGSVNSRLNATGTTTLGNVNFVYNNASNLGDGKGLVLGGSILVNAATTANFTNAAAGVGRIELNANTTTDVGAGGTMNVAWVVDEFGGARSFTKNGTGTLILSAANTYTGGTTLNSGTLNINNASAIGNGTLTINGGTLNNASGSAITLSTNNIQSWNGDFAFTGTNNLNIGTGEVAMNASRTVTVNAGNLTVGGSISGSGFGLTKNGSGTLVLSGSNSYTGNTTINSGTLRAAAAGAVGNSSQIIVNNGGSFLVTADDAIGTNTGINLGTSSTTTPGLVFSGNYSGHVGALTLSADSIIDLGTSSVRLIFASIAGLCNYNLSIWNWSGNTQWSGSPGGGTDQLSFTDASGLSGNLSRISFYSDLGQSLISNNAFTVGSNPTEIVAVPEPGLIITAAALLLFLLFRLARQHREANRAEKA